MGWVCFPLKDAGCFGSQCKHAAQTLPESVNNQKLLPASFENLHKYKTLGVPTPLSSAENKN